MAVFEKVACSFAETIVIFGEPREELVHDAVYAVLAALEEDVDMNGREDPGADCAFPLCNVQTEAFKENGSVLVVLEDVGLVDALHS